jgi:hypothetical protein
MAPPSYSLGVRVLDRIRVSPPPPSDSARERVLPLTFFDVAWIFTGPVELLFTAGAAGTSGGHGNAAVSAYRPPGAPECSLLGRPEAGVVRYSVLGTNALAALILKDGLGNTVF